MPKRFLEEPVLFVSVLKWVVLATIVGTIVGLATTGFLLALNAGTKFSNHYNYFFLLLPLAFLISTAAVQYLAPEAEGHGTEKVIEAIHRRSGKIKGAVVPVKLVATIVTLVAGGSAGKEGPCAQIGGGLASIFADLLRFNDNDHKKLVICGISAGFASVFGTPIAGALFGVEVLFIGGLLYDVLLPSFISGIMAYQVSAYLGMKYFYYPIVFSPVFSEAFFLKVMAAGIFFGLCALFFVETIRAGEQLAEKIKFPKLLKAICAGGALVLLALIFSRRFLGLGLDTIEDSLKGLPIHWYDFILKSIFTSLTLNFGGSGGIVTPIFFVGACSGTLFATIFHLDLATFAALGLVSLLAGAANTPIAASVMAMEMFGPAIAPYAAVACVISFLITGHRSVYPSQILSFSKSPSIAVELGQEIVCVVPRAALREKSVLSALFKILRIKNESNTDCK